MPPGKLASQAGHAYLNSFIAASRANPEIENLYQPDGLGTKVCLRAKNQEALLKAYKAAQEAGIPCSLIIDQHHIMPPHFTGDPIITALGIGPIQKASIHHITKRFSLCH